MLNSAELIGNHVNVRWSDGVVEEFPTVWLLHACTCAECGLSIKGVRNLKLTNFQKRPRPQNVRVFSGSGTHLDRFSSSNSII